MLDMYSILTFIANLFNYVRGDQVIEPFESAVIILLSSTTGV